MWFFILILMTTISYAAEIEKVDENKVKLIYTDEREFDIDKIASHCDSYNAEATQIIEHSTMVQAEANQKIQEIEDKKIACLATVEKVREFIKDGDKGGTNWSDLDIYR